MPQSGNIFSFLSSSLGIRQQEEEGREGSGEGHGKKDHSRQIPDGEIRAAVVEHRTGTHR